MTRSIFFNGCAPTGPACERRSLSPRTRSWLLVFAGFAVSGCAVSFNDWPQGNGAGGSTGGHGSGQGGSTNSGGALNALTAGTTAASTVGGAGGASAGGASATGGANTLGGSGGQATTTTGGSLGTTASTGGASGAGGASAGGASAIGGVSTLGGSGGQATTTTGGSPGTTASTGGASATEAATSSGGGFATGGVTNTGGVPTTGGSSAGGGTIAATGGASATGGTSNTGGAAPTTGGATGTGGNSACGAGCTNSNTLDDFEDGDVTGCQRNSWVGSWWLASDGTGTLTNPASATDKAGLQVQLSPLSGTSCRGLHMSGYGFSSWGANVGFTFNNPDDTVPRAVDLSGFSGVSFWLRGSGSVWFLVGTTDTEPPDNGGTCSTNCKQHFSIGTFAVPSTWTNFQESFSTLFSNTANRYWSASDLGKVLFIALQTTSSASFDLWVDDVALLP
jgi:hypothetical protein